MTLIDTDREDSFVGEGSRREVKVRIIEKELLKISMDKALENVE